MITYKIWSPAVWCVVLFCLGSQTTNVFQGAGSLKYMTKGTLSFIDQVIFVRIIISPLTSNQKNILHFFFIFSLICQSWPRRKNEECYWYKWYITNQATSWFFYHIWYIFYNFYPYFCNVLRHFLGHFRQFLERFFRYKYSDNFL